MNKEKNNKGEIKMEKKEIVDEADIEAFQYGMLSAYVDLCKRVEGGGYPVGVIEAIRSLNYKKKIREEKERFKWSKLY